jgi:hypothetical protein
VDRHLGAGEPLQLGDAADVVDIGVGEDDVAEVEGITADPLVSG